MTRFIILTFAFMAWAFYEVSGGSDFKPRQQAIILRSDALASQPIDSRPPHATLLKAPLLSTDIESVIQQADTKRLNLNTPPMAALPPDAYQSGKSRVFSLADFTSSPENIAFVRGQNVNLRTGPGTRFMVVSQLRQNSVVKVLQAPHNGWIKLKSMETGRVGWISARFLVGGTG